MQEISKSFPQAKKIILVQDNLNTHSPSAFYQTLPPEKAFELMSRFEMNFKQCLNRRIGTMETLRKETIIWAKDRSDRGVKIN